MSSLKNANKSAGRVHRERSQPADRRHLGEFEKKKDYKKRAAAYSRNQNVIRKLRRRALERNPDEFYFHMVNSKIENGMHYEKPKQKDEDTEEQTLIMQSQDEKYIRLKLQVQNKKIARILDEFGALFAHCQKNSEPKENEKGVDSFEEHCRPIHSFEDCANEETTEEANCTGRKALISLSSADVKRLSAKLPCPISRSKLAIAVSDLHPDKMTLFRELLSRLHVESELRVVAEKIRMKKLVAESVKKGVQPKRIKRGTEERPPIYRWKYERKR